MAPAPERVGPTFQLPSGLTFRSAPGEAMLEALGQLQRPAERLGLLTQHLLLLRLPAAGLHPLRQSSRHHPLATEWIPWPCSSPSLPPPSLSSSERGAGWSGPWRPPLRRPPRPVGPLQEKEGETRRWDTSPEQS